MSTIQHRNIGPPEQILGRFPAVTRTPYPWPGVSKEEIKQADAKELYHIGVVAMAFRSLSKKFG